MEKYTLQDIKYFIKEVVVEALRKDNLLKRRRPVEYSMSVITDNKKSKIYVLDFSMSIDSVITEPLEFRINSKKFICKEYDFSYQWQQYLKQQQSIKSI